MKRLLFLFVVVFVLFLFFSVNQKSGQDAFVGVLIEGRPVNAENAEVLADTDCIPTEAYITLTCTAIIQANDQIIKVRYTHPIKTPCLSKGDKVNISMKRDSTVEIIRLGKPSMEH
ncbi:hypothetical protein [Thermococcus barophilus]|uniref:Uncharacterized protein n=1 Tax=Thermococcus barophilus TaxID=55802 RepID=A0A0S1XCV8_THEBA|nr:hypothetical protein [Thermococcus barophilus]ALM75560.1 conserved exported hypothetical protein [Thermococcus barophilus]